MANDLMIYGAIAAPGAELIGDDVSPLAVVSEILKSAGKPLTVRINSPGGSVWGGLSITTAIRAHGNVTTIVDGIAASMASSAFLAGRRRIMQAGSRVMIHDPSACVMGRSQDMRKEADVIDGIAADMALMYSESTGGKVSVEDAAAMMAAETWLTPEQAVELGFAHSIEGKRTAFARIPETMQYRNAPKEVMQMSTEPNEAPGLLDRMMAKLTGTEQMRADLAQAEGALIDATARITSAEARATTAETALAAAQVEHAAALESAIAAARIEGAQENQRQVLKAAAPNPVPHVEESTETFATHSAKWDSLRASGDHVAAGKYYEAHRNQILAGA